MTDAPLLSINRPGPAYQAVGAPDAPRTANLIVIFRPDATEEDIRDALRASGASLAGLYQSRGNALRSASRFEEARDNFLEMEALATEERIGRTHDAVDLGSLHDPDLPLPNIPRMGSAAT